MHPLQCICPTAVAEVRRQICQPRTWPSADPDQADSARRPHPGRGKAVIGFDSRRSVSRAACSVPRPPGCKGCASELPISGYQTAISWLSSPTASPTQTSKWDECGKHAAVVRSPLHSTGRLAVRTFEPRATSRPSPQAPRAFAHLPASCSAYLQDRHFFRGDSCGACGPRVGDARQGDPRAHTPQDSRHRWHGRRRHWLSEHFYWCVCACGSGRRQGGEAW
jgi:hypothetical protein